MANRQPSVIVVIIIVVVVARRDRKEKRRSHAPPSCACACVCRQPVRGISNPIWLTSHDPRLSQHTQTDRQRETHPVLDRVGVRVHSKKTPANDVSFFDATRFRRERHRARRNGRGQSDAIGPTTTTTTTDLARFFLRVVCSVDRLNRRDRGPHACPSRRSGSG